MNNVKLARNATDSVSADATGMSARRKPMLRIIVRRVVTAIMAFMTVDMMSWNGTTAHAMLRPGARPPVLRTNVTRSR